MLIDLSDARRGKKPWLPADDRDVTNGLVAEDAHGKPACVRHGAMNRVDPHRSLWRCSEMYCGVGAELIPGVEDDHGVRVGLERLRAWMAKHEACMAGSRCPSCEELFRVTGGEYPSGLANDPTSARRPPLAPGIQVPAYPARLATWT